MNKKARYISGAVAVALLTAGSPIIVPMLNPVGVVKADTDIIKGHNVTNESLSPSDMLTAFKSQFDDRYVASSQSITSVLNSLAEDSENNFNYFDLNNPKYIHDFQNSGQIAMLKDTSKTPIPSSYFYSGSNNNYYYRDMLVAMTIADKDGNNIDISDTDKLKNLTMNDSEFPLTATIHISESKDSDLAPLTSLATVTDPSLLEFSFKISLSRFDISKNQSMVPITVGSSLSSLSTEGNGLKITDNYTNDPKYTSSLTSAEKPMLGQSLFTSREKAAEYAAESDFDPTSTDKGNASPDQFSDGKIISNGTYYQTVSYNLSGADSAIEDMLTGDKSDVTGAAVSPYQTFINGSNTAATPGTDYVLNRDTKTITVIRKLSTNATINAKLSIPQVKVNSLISDAKPTAADYLSDQSGENTANDIPTSNVEVGSEYYTDPSLKSNYKATSDEVSATNFLKPGKYYRTIKFTLKNGSISDYDALPLSIDSDSKGNTVTYVQEVDVRNDATANYDNPLDAKIGDTSNTVSKNDTLISTDSSTGLSTNLIQDNGISFGNKYYRYTPGKEETLQNEVLNGSNDDSLTDGVVDSSGKFAKSGDFLRTITYTLVANSVDTNTFDTTNSKYKLGTDSKGNDTITYVQKVHVSQIPVIVSIKDLIVHLGAKNYSDQLELARESIAENDITTDGSSSSSLLDPANDPDPIESKLPTGIVLGDDYYTDRSLKSKSSTGLSSAGTYYRKITFYLTADVNTLSFGDNIPWAKDEDKNSVTFVQKIRVLTNVVTASVPCFMSQIGKEVMSQTMEDQSITTEADATLSLTTDSVSIAYLESSDNKFYSSEDNAQEGINAITFSRFNNVFTVPGTYYRKVIFHLEAGTDAKNYVFPKINDLDPVFSTADDGKIPTVEYLQKIVINSPELIVQTDHYASDIVTIGEDMSKVMDDSILTSLSANGSVIANGTVGTEYFDDATHAVKNEDPVSGTTFTEAKPYYRRVTFKLPGDISKYTSFSGEEGVDYTIDKSNNTITYAQKINVIDPRVTVTIPDISINVNAPVSSIDDDTKGISFISNETGKSIVSQDKIFVYSHRDPTSDSEPDYYFKDSSLTDIIKDIQNQNWMFKDGNRVFTAPGKYYRLIMFTAENLPDYYTFSDTNNGSTEKSNNNTTVGYYIQRVNVGYPVTVKIDDSVSSKVGSDITSVDAGNYDLISSEESGKSIVDTSATSYGTEYYDIFDDVKDILDKKVEPISDVTDGEKFTKSGTYYRVIKFVLKSGETPSNYSFGNGKLSSDGKSVEYIQKVNIATGEVTAVIDRGETKFGETLPSDSLGAKVDLVLSDGGGSIMSDGKITYGNKYYKSIDEALRGKNPLDTVSNAADPYYRTVTFTLKNPVDSYTFSGDHLIDKDNNTVTFAQEIKVEPANAVFSVKPLDDIETKTSTTDQKVTQTDGYTLVGSTSVKVGNIYYKSRDGALKDALNPGMDKSLIATDATSGNYLNEGDWYRLIYFTVNDDFFNNYEVSDDNMKKVDNHTVVYAQPVNVSHSTAVTKPEITNGKAIVDNSINTVQSGVNKLLDSNNVVISENPSFGSDYYDNYDDVFDADAAKSTRVVNGEFKKAGTYYRKITFTLTDDALAANNFDANAHVSGNTVSYVQTVNVAAKTNINIDADSTVNVTAGSAESTLTNNYKLTDDDNNSVGTLSTSNKIAYYGELSDALAQNTKTDSDAISGGNFNAGKYYRLLVFTPNAGVNKDNYSLNNSNLAWSADGTKILFAQEINASANAVSKYNISTPKVTIGSSEEDSETSNGNQIFDHSGKEISASVTFGKDYYANSGDVFDKNAKPVDGVVVDDNFVKVDTYYREIIFHLSHADIVNNSFGNAKVDTNNNTVSYVQAVVVSQSNVARINVNPISVKVGTSVDSVKNTDTLTDATNNPLGTATVDNSKFYDKATDALSGTNEDVNATTNGLFNKGTYYRLVTFKTVSDFAKNYALNDLNARVNTDGSVTYAQKIDVKANGVVKHNFGDISANIGESTDKVAVATGTLTDASGNEIKASVSAESIYYDNYDDVFSGTGKVTEGINADKQFTKAGTYYRKISFKLDSSVDIKNYDFGSDAHVSGNTVSFVQSVVVGENAASITVGPLNIKTGTRTNDQSVTSTDGYVLRAGDDSFTDPTLGMTYYKSINGALGKSNGDEVDPNAVTAVTDGAFNKGTYYRQVVFKVGNDFVDKYNWADTTNAMYKDGTVIYAQQINVKDNVVSKHTIEDAKTNVGDSVTAVTSTGNALMDASGNKLDATVSYGTDYYDNYDDVFTPNAAKTKDIANGAFTKAGTYYRVINFKVSPEAIAQNDFGSEAHISGNTVSFVQAVSIDNKVNMAVNINVTPTITVSADTATNDSKLTKTTGYTLSNNLGTVLATVSAGDKYYTDVQSALKQGDTGLADVNGQFTKAGTYYRVITFKPSKAIDANSISNPSARVNADGTISYVQAVTVTKNAANINSSVGELDLRANAEKDNPALINTKEYSLKDVAGNSLVDKTKGTYGVELGQTFYTDSGLTQKTTDASGARISKAGTYYRAVKFYLTSGAAAANQFESIGGTYDATDNSVTFVQMIKASAAPVTPSNPAIAKINNVTVDNGTSMTDKALQNTDDVYIVDKNGDSIIADGGIKFDTTLYDSVGRPVTNLKTAGTYSQVITVKLESNVSAYTFGEGYKVDPTNNTISYVRTVTVKAASSTGGNSGNTGGSTGGNSGSSTETGGSTGAETDEDDDWNYSPIQGVVTTKTDHLFYTLNNQDNDKIPNRVLGKDSSWKTDQIRVNKAGVTQYRVATGEWIYADDVVLNQNSSEDGDWTYTPVQGVVTTKTDQKKYQLNNHENTAIANRDLKEDSSWKTDLYRTNKEGVRQYRVATGEWIDADDVNFNQNEDDFWTYESVSGVVKTKAGQTEYQLNDHENKAIAHRDLKEETSWKTDLYRTNEAGVKQYRVATGEWIDANDVDFINNNKNDEGWIYTSISGIVTTKPNQANYQLNNQNNSAIAGRELVKDSSWKTDQYRTNREGIKQYRVATGEWVDANDVVYEDAVDTGVFRDGRKISGVINLDRTNIFYDLYSRENEIIEDYSLGEETSWKTDYKAQDVNGDTYYHVGDNEWIKAEKGVHFNNYAWY